MSIIKRLTAWLEVAVTASICSGCLNIQGHCAGTKQYQPYDSTKVMARGIAEACVENPEWHWGSYGEARMAHAYAAILLPFYVVGLPMETMADTVTFPYDYWNANRRE